jgi:hypothetical protein
MRHCQSGAGKVIPDRLRPCWVAWLSPQHLLPSRVRSWFDQKSDRKHIPDRRKRLPLKQLPHRVWVA